MTTSNISSLGSICKVSAVGSLPRLSLRRYSEMLSVLDQRSHSPSPGAEEWAATPKPR